MNSVTLTDSAIEAGSSALEEESDEIIGIRVGVVGGGCSGYSYALEFIDSDDIDEDDIKMEFVNLTVFIDPHSAQMLEGTEIDYIQTLQKKGFVFNNPNASRTCGCGSSFS